MKIYSTITHSLYAIKSENRCTTPLFNMHDFGEDLCHRSVIHLQNNSTVIFDTDEITINANISGDRKTILF